MMRDAKPTPHVDSFDKKKTYGNTVEQSIEFGPYHAWLPGHFRLGLGLNGDEILDVDLELGYTTRSISSMVEGKTLDRVQSFVSRISPENALIADLLVGQVLEGQAKLSVSDRADWIRDIAVLLGEVSSALKFIASVAQRMRLLPLMQIALKHREDLSDLTELLTGSRYGYDFILPGGVRYDLSDGFSERLERWIVSFRADLLRIEAMFFWRPGIASALSSIGVVTVAGMGGWIAKTATQDTKIGPISHVLSRLQGGLRSATEMTERLMKLIQDRVPGDIRYSVGASLQGGERVSRYDSYRGNWELKIKFESDGIVNHFDLLTPSHQILHALPAALVHENIEDVPLILESLNFVVSEVDQ
jgi:NADH:ubiquinone oxidoreductase subunit D